MQRTLQHLSSFKQNTKTGAACTQHPTKSTQHTGIENITTQLNHWMHQGDLQERRIEAKQRILEAYRTQATVLHLSALNLRELPPQIEQLQSLESLCLWNNNLQTLPAGIGQLSRLVKLNLGRNAFNKLPIEIAQLTWTQTLSNALQIFSILGSIVTGEVLNNLGLRHYAQNMANIVVRGILGPEPLSCLTRRHSHTLELDNTKAVNSISPDLQTSIQEAVLKALAPVQQQLNALNREINQLKQKNKALRQQLSQTAQQPHRLRH